MKLTIFNDLSFLPALKAMLKEMNVPINYIADEPTTAKEILPDTFKDNSTFKLIDEIYFVGMVDDAAFEGNKSIDSRKIKSDYDGVLIFGVTLHEREKGLLPTRSQLAEISRAFNREFYYTPVIVVFKYDRHLAFANTERLPYKQEWREGEKAGKVTLLRDINIKRPHSGHERILNELRIPTSGKNAVDSFAKLYAYWQEVFSVSILNKKFYLELSNWYFWAIKQVTFPGMPTAKDAHLKNTDLDDLIQEHKATNVIRMLTRLLFVWFVKEKKLIPEDLFDLETLQNDILKKISPYHEHGMFKEANSESIYYKAILQNLFFATLNCPIEADSLDKRKRAFRGESYGANRGIDYLMRYKTSFKNPDKFLELVNQTVPFLNGGLFECLDDKENNIYIDGFSDGMTKGQKLIVPDYLFFGIEEKTDLSKEYGINNKDTKGAAVKGLINILKSYKFTITENTPIEEDVALDPELLGKVFENLLASYNPETKITARKQTGSFYTPREIVNYMVDESLITYLKNRILSEKQVFIDMGRKQTNMFGNNGVVGQQSFQVDITGSELKEDEENLNALLYDLVSFNPGNPFLQYPNTVNIIVKYLNECTILDPACGSGAFPMGVLQKMVHILQKLDPDNKIWKQVQEYNAKKEADEAFSIEDKKAREQRLLEINEAFDQSINDPDYARKLFLIENCIYGVDIQPIATQISKLRFFISLVVEQKVNSSRENFGIRPLPNLETKFVAANTLKGIDKPSTQLSLYDTTEVKALVVELKKVRHKLFSAKSKDTKLKYRQLDEDLRTAIAAELEKSGWKSETAQKLAGWDPYDQNTSCPFFDPEWMFDINGKFDIITGNPPWGAYLSQADKLYFKEFYKNIDSSTPNSFAYFIGEAINHSKGVISFVLPDSILIKDFSKTREYIKDWVYEISWYLNTGIPEENRPFVYVEHDVSVIFINKLAKLDKCKIKKHLYDFKEKKTITDSYTIQKNQFIKKEHEFSFNLKVRDTETKIYDFISNLDTLSEILQCHEGIHTGNSRELLFHKTKINQFCKPLFYGGRAGDIINNYVSQTSGWFVDYRSNIINKDKGYYASLRDEKIFELPKIYITRTGNPLKAFYDENSYASNNFFSLQFKNYKKNNKESLNALLPLIISKFSNYFIRTFAAPRLGDTFIETKIFHVLKLPFPPSLFEYKSIKILCDIIINEIKNKKPFLTYQIILDSILLELYFSTHMKEKEINILEFIERDIANTANGRNFEMLNSDEKLIMAEQLNLKWSHPDNEVRNRIKLFAVRSPEILKPILES